MEFLIGIFVGALLFYVFAKRKRASGTFVIDLSDPSKDVCRLELDESLNNIYTKKQVIFKVKAIEASSQE